MNLIEQNSAKDCKMESNVWFCLHRRSTQASLTARQAAYIIRVVSTGLLVAHASCRGRKQSPPLIVPILVVLPQGCHENLTTVRNLVLYSVGIHIPIMRTVQSLALIKGQATPYVQSSECGTRSDLKISNGSLDFIASAQSFLAVYS